MLVEMTRARVARDEWRKRVRRWKASGLSAEEFAADVGINAGTLQVWRSKLKHDDVAPTRRPRRSPSAAILSSLIEVRAPAVTGPDVTHSELHALRLQLVTDLPDQLSGGDRIVGEPPGPGGVAPGQCVQERSRRVLRVGPEETAASRQDGHQGRQQDGYQT